MQKNNHSRLYGVLPGVPEDVVDNIIGLLGRYALQLEVDNEGKIIVSGPGTESKEDGEDGGVQGTE